MTNYAKLRRTTKTKEDREGEKGNNKMHFLIFARTGHFENNGVAKFSRNFVAAKIVLNFQTNPNFRTKLFYYHILLLLIFHIFFAENFPEN